MTTITITIDRTLLEQTLQALVRTYHYGGVIAADAECITALRAALAQQAEPVEPVAWAFRHSDGTYHDPSVTEHSAGMVPLYPPPPQRKPLPKHDQHCVDVPGYGLMAVRLVRAVERAHGITGDNNG